MFSKLTTKTRLETGFSMLEAVVVVGVLLAIAVGGFFAFGPITENAKTAGVKSAASSVHTAVLVAASDGDPETTHQQVVTDYNASQTKIRVGLHSAVTVEDLCIEAVWVADETITARNGSCPEPEATAPAPTPTPAPAYDSQTPPPALPVGFVMRNNVTVQDETGNPKPFHVTAINTQSGQTIHNASYQVGWVANFEEYVDIPADQVDTAPRPEYLVTVTVEGVERSYTITSDKYIENNGGYEIHLDAFLEGNTFRLQYPPAAGAGTAETVNYAMLTRLDIDFNNDGSPDQGYPYRLTVVNLTVNELIFDQSGTGTGFSELEDIVAYPTTQIPVYEFTVTSPNGTFSYQTSTTDYKTGSNGGQQMSWSSRLTMDGFTHTPNPIG